MNRLFISMVLCVMLAFANSAWALKIDGTIDVGVKDTLLFQSELENSDPDTELIWVKSVLHDSTLVFTDRIETPENSGLWSQTDTSGIYALDLGGTPDWFLIKTGKIGAGQPNRDFLFQNNNSLSWAVVQLSDMGIIKITNVDKISHVSEFGGSTPVPEPGTMVLLGAGLLGLAIFGKRRMNK